MSVTLEKGKLYVARGHYHADRKVVNAMTALQDAYGDNEIMYAFLHVQDNGKGYTVMPIYLVENSKSKILNFKVTQGYVADDKVRFTIEEAVEIRDASLKTLEDLLKKVLESPSPPQTYVFTFSVETDCPAHRCASPACEGEAAFGPPSGREKTCLGVQDRIERLKT